MVIPVALRADYDATRLRRLARRAKDGPQTQRLLASAAIYNGSPRTEAAQIGGVLEPVGALPVIIEDDVLVGGNCGVYEGTVVKRRAVLGSGVILTRSTPVYDVARGVVLSAKDDEPLVIPEGAVVVAGSRAITSGKGKEWGVSLYTPVIVKYRDEKTNARVQLEDLLR